MPSMSLVVGGAQTLLVVRALRLLRLFRIFKLGRWAIVTMTTVGYGDIAPRTVPGQVLASIVMLMGYAIIAVPTGIVSVELAQAKKYETGVRACRRCSVEGHDADAVFCKKCGARLG